MQIKNSTSISNDKIREIARFVQPAGVARVLVKITNSTYGARGRGGQRLVLVRIDPKEKFPYLRHKNHLPYLPVWLYTSEEALVYIMAHEFRHCWQTKHPRGYRVWGARGQYSERDACAYGIRKLREWRRREKGLPRIKDCANALSNSNSNGQSTASYRRAINTRIDQPEPIGAFAG